MSAEMFKKLDAMFDAKSEALTEEARVKREIEERQKANIAAFLELKESVIRPTLERFVEYLKGNGKASHIEELGDSERGNRYSETISIRLEAADAQRPLSHVAVPHFMMSVDKNIGRVNLYNTEFPRRDGVALGLGSVGFDGLNEEMISQYVFDEIAAALRR